MRIPWILVGTLIGAMIGPGLVRYLRGGPIDPWWVICVFSPVVIGALIGWWLDWECAKPRERRLRFSLQKMFIVGTALIVCLGWLSWQWRDIRRREMMVAQLRSDGGRVYILSYEQAQRREPFTDQRGHIVRFPFWRMLFGDEYISGVEMPEHYSPEQTSAFLEAFPEAQMTWSAMPVP